VAGAEGASSITSATVGKIWMITIYSKNVRENISAQVLKQMKGALEKWAR